LVRAVLLWIVRRTNQFRLGWFVVVRIFQIYNHLYQPALPIYGAIVAWAYLSASARLGVVDLFACEILTLCRVGTAFDIGKHYVDQYDSLRPREKRGAVNKQPAGSANFVSQEDYFPVFDNNSRDLQVLEASVVRNITAFYTYMKATRDAQRRLAQTKPPQASETTLENA
jgi:hypothetical protein